MVQSVIRRSCVYAAFAAVIGVAIPMLAQAAPKHHWPKTTTPPPLQFHYIGPPAGGRVASVAGIAGNYSTYYLGSASGGLWKTTDGGHTFMPVFDGEDTSAIGAIAVAPSDPNTVWVGTGEPWVIRPSDIIGDGVYKSTDGGKTWQNMGLVKTGRIARILVNPKDVNNVLVCAEGTDSGPQQERGVFRTTDGGKTWQRTLFVNPQTGCSGISMDPSDPNTLLAGMWQVTVRTWAENSGGPGSGVYISHDNGKTWQHLTHGLPKPPLGKIDVAIAPSNPQRMYALIQTKDQGSVWRSDDGGTSWKVVSWDRSLIMRAGYYIRIAVNPKDENGVLVLNSGPHYSMDGGHTFSGEGGKGVMPFGPASCGDCHDLWIDPTNPQHYVLTDDGGAQIATGAGTALTVALPNGQIYHVASDNQVPYWIYGNRQDDGAWRLSSDISQPSGNGLLPVDEFMPEGNWYEDFYPDEGDHHFKVNKKLLAQYPKQAPIPKGWALGPNGWPKVAPDASGFGGAYQPKPTWQDFSNACESGFTIPDPANPNIVWSSCYGNRVYRIDLAQGTPHGVAPSEVALDSPVNKVKYRCNWTTPLTIDPFEHNNVYLSCQMVLRTDNAGHSWSKVSPDLTTDNPAHLKPSGGLMGDHLGQYYGEVIWSMTFSPIQRGLLWAGTNDGKLWYTKDAEAQHPHWVDVTANLHLPPWGEINQIAPSHFDPGTAYIAVDYRHAGHNNHKPYLLMTTDFGRTWKNIDGDIPSSNPLDYTLSIAENPNRKDMLFVGTGHAFYYTLNNGRHWVHFNKGLPPAPVDWINMEPRMHDIDLSTYGRGVFEMPDITTFEQTGSPAQPSSGPSRLFKPGEVFRKARGGYPTPAEPARPQFQFYLASAPKNPVELQILDGQNQVIRTEKLQAHQGLNGAYWNLFYTTPVKIKILTTPSQNPYIWQEPRYKGKTYRRLIHWGLTPHTGTPIAAPGGYKVRLTVNGQTYTQPFQLVKDPRIVASDAVLQQSTALQVQIADAITETSNMVNTMEQWRKQIQDQLKAHPSGPEAGSLRQLNAEILTVENQLVSPEARLSDDKQYAAAYKVYWNLLSLAGEVGQGVQNEAGGSDYEPTVVNREVFAKLQAQIATARSGFENLKSSTLPAFNRKMSGDGISIKMSQE